MLVVLNRVLNTVAGEIRGMSIELGVFPSAHFRIVRPLSKLRCSLLRTFGFHAFQVLLSLNLLQCIS